MADKKIILFVEGESKSPNGDLRQGLSKLLAQKLNHKLPSIVLGDCKTQTINKFLKNRRPCDLTLLLIDLYKQDNEINQDLKNNQLLARQSDVFYMVQEMESWFISQPKILNAFYGCDNNKKKISDKLLKKKATEISKPNEELIKITKTTQNRSEPYHKIKHAIELLKLLDATKLEDDFTEFKRLIARIKN